MNKKNFDVKVRKACVPACCWPSREEPWRHQYTT